MHHGDASLVVGALGRVSGLPSLSRLGAGQERDRGRSQRRMDHDTCAIRLSRTLNYNAVPVPSNLAGLLTVSGGDRKKYALRVRETRAWLLQTLGRPAFDQTKKEGAAFDKSLLATMRGIIGFDI